jgi:hypothetical protein
MKNKKKLVLIVVAVAVLVLGWIGYSKWRDEQIFRELQAGGMDAVSPKDWQKLPDILAAKYRADNYGSTTPEGTLSMFVEALKKGDADLASKYFIAEKQSEYRQAVFNWTRLGKNIEIADNLIQATDGSENIPGSYIMTVFDNSVAQNSVYFIKNNFSGKWKLQSI